MSGNKIKSLDEIKHLSSLEHLDSLDMVGNPVMGDPPKDTPAAADGSAATAETGSGNEEIKVKIREMLPKLEVLNGFNKEN